MSTDAKTIRNAFVFDESSAVSQLVHREAEIKSKEEQKWSKVMIASKEIGGIFLLEMESCRTQSTYTVEVNAATYDKSCQ